MPAGERRLHHGSPLTPFPYTSFVEVAHGALGALSVGQGSGRVVLLRKVVRSAVWDDATLEGLADAATRARGLHHPSRLAVVDSNRGIDTLTVATEYMEGVPLSLLMQRARQKRYAVSTGAALRVAEELVRAAVAAEESSADDWTDWTLAGLHPECVLISRGDDALLADLSTASLERAPAHPTVAAYRAPEASAARGSAGAAVFSIGAIVWELLAGRELFEQSAPSATVEGVRKKALDGSLPRLGDLAPSVPSLLSEIVMQSLRADPSARFPSASALGEALTAVRHERRPGELERLLGDLGADILERLQNATLHQGGAMPSGRPTMHTIDASVLAIPKAPRLIGLAAFQPVEVKTPEPSVESGRAVDALLEPSPPSAGPSPAPPTSARGPQETVPLLLVDKRAPEAPAPSPPPAPAAARLTTEPGVTLDDLQFAPRRRWGPLVVVTLGLCGAVGVAVVALTQQPEPERETPIATASAAQPDAVDAALEHEVEPTPDAAPRPKRVVTQEPRQRDRKRDAGSQQAEPQPKPTAKPAAPDPGSDNPYVDPPVANPGF